MRAAVEQHGGRLTCYAAQLTGNLDTARDVVQDTFLRLCEEGVGSDRSGYRQEFLKLVEQASQLAPHGNQR